MNGELHICADERDVEHIIFINDAIGITSTSLLILS